LPKNKDKKWNKKLKQSKNLNLFNLVSVCVGVVVAIRIIERLLDDLFNGSNQKAVDAI